MGTQGKEWRIHTTTLALAACFDDQHEGRNAASIIRMMGKTGLWEFNRASLTLLD